MRTVSQQHMRAEAETLSCADLNRFTHLFQGSVRDASLQIWGHVAYSITPRRNWHHLAAAVCVPGTFSHLLYNTAPKDRHGAGSVSVTDGGVGRGRHSGGADVGSICGRHPGVAGILCISLVMIVVLKRPDRSRAYERKTFIALIHPCDRGRSDDGKNS